MSFADMAPIDFALVALAIAGIWAIVEVALTLRGVRGSLSEVMSSVNQTINELNPVIAKLDGVADELNPVVKQVEPLLEKTGTAVDALSLDLIRVEEILGDVSSVTGTATNVTGAVSKVTGSAADAAAGLIGKITHKGVEPEPARLGAVAPTASEPVSEPAPEKAERGGYFTYGPKQDAPSDEGASKDAE